MTTLTLKQQEQSISKGKKKQSRNLAKVVLCSPFENYKPLLNSEDAIQIESLLSKILIKEKPKVKVPWKKLIKFPKSFRKQQIQEHMQQFPISEELQRQRKNLKFGLNAVSRAIQGSKIISCILAGDAQPDIIVKPLITLAAVKNKPVIILPKLREITCKLVGFPCSALGIELLDEQHSSYKLLNDAIIDMWKKFSLPLRNVNHSKPNDDKMNEDDQVLYNIVDKSREAIKSSDIYLYRESTNVRVFQPPANDSKTIDKSFSTALDFISLNVDNSQQIYIPPNLKRTVKNTNKIRKKRKVDEL